MTRVASSSGAGSVESAPEAGIGPSHRLGVSVNSILMAVLPVVAAVICGGILLALLGRDPVSFYSNVVGHGLLGSLGNAACGLSELHSTCISPFTSTK